MADPLFGASILDELRRDGMHAEDLDKTLEDLRRLLGERQIPFALLGAMAMRHRGFVRHTEDIDILTTREGLDRLHQRIVGLGIVPRGMGLRKSLRHTIYNVNIDVIQSGEHAGSQNSPLVYPDPMSEAFVEEGGIRVPTIDKLVDFKLVSGIWGHRPDDFGDVFNLIRANRLDESMAERLIPEVRAKYLELLGESRQEVTLQE